MSDIESTLNLIEKLEEATPVEQTTSTEKINLSSSYISQIAGQDDKSSAFLTGNTIDAQIDNISEISSSTRQSAEDLGLDLGMYDPEAKKKALEAQALAEAQAKKAANDKLIAEKKAKEAEARAIERAKRIEELKKFIKLQSDADKKLGYSRGFLFGILFSMLLLIASIIFFRNQLISFISTDFDSLLDKTSTDISHLVNNIMGNEDILDTVDVNNNTITISKDNEIVNSDLGNENNEGSDTNPDELTDIDKEGEDNQEDIKEYVDNEENTDNSIIANEYTDIEDDSALKFSIVYTNDTSLANRVISANCNSLFCGDYTKATDESDIIFCTEFRQNEFIKDGDHRIGKSGSCRYKDSSELAILTIE